MHSCPHGTNGSCKNKALSLPLSMVDTIRYLTASYLFVFAGRVHLTLWRLKILDACFPNLPYSWAQADDTMLDSETEK